ncbi:MAG: biotin--[Oscillospiraceae bacterium]|nr:biotin--[acetyl-CoA-carboxylase] ligase [Oscillospiraceae bacterium]
MQLKEQILHELLHAGGEYRSGAALAKAFGCSRTAVWKSIEQLKSDGCEISASTNRGYRLVRVPDLLIPSYLKSLLEGCQTDWQPQYIPVIDSTNNRLKELAAAGAPAGTVILSDEQTGGKGRLGKHFHSPKGGLYFSLLLRPDLPVSDMMSVTACTASAVHQALSSFGIKSQIKWVNDLFIGGRKICGILSEGAFNAELLSMDYLIIGIGINLIPDPDLPEELRSIVTDICSETGIRLQRSELAAAILRHLEQYIADLPQHTYLPVYKANSCTLGHHVEFTVNGTQRTALAVDFTEDAALVVEYADGTQETIRSGTARPID